MENNNDSWFLIDPKNDIQKPQKLVVFWRSLGWQTALWKSEPRKKKKGNRRVRVCRKSSRCTVSTSRALIDLRLLNFVLIKEWSCSAPFFFWLYLFGFGLDAAGLNVSMVRCPLWMSGALASVYFCSDKFFLFHVEIWEVTAQWGSHQRQCVTEQSNM